MNFWKKNKIYIVISLVLIIFAGIIYILNRPNKVKNQYVETEPFIFFRNYEVNEFVPVYITDEQMARIYFNDYIQKMLYRSAEAYELLDDTLRTTTFSTYELYETYVTKLKSRNLNFVFDHFNVSTKDNREKYTIFDTNNHMYVFDVEAVMEYKVYFDVIE